MQCVLYGAKFKVPCYKLKPHVVTYPPAAWSLKITEIDLVDLYYKNHTVWLSVCLTINTEPQSRKA